MSRRGLLAAASVLGVLSATPAFARQVTGAPPRMPTDLSPEGVRAIDDHLALEEVDGEEAMRFVRAENEKSLAALTGDPRYETYRAEAEEILTATDRIPTPVFLGDHIANFWQDADHPKGIWRRTTLDSYRSGAPEWETLLDIDQLARDEGKDWVWKGFQALPPQETNCLISLSDGGKDAVVVREFLTDEKIFADPVNDGGFALPEGKHRLAWLDENTLLVATDFGPGTLTESGYPYIVKRLSRGQTLDQAVEVYRGDQSDGGYGVSASVYRDKDGGVEAIIISRPLDTYRQETWHLVEGAPVKLTLPSRLSIYGTSAGLLIFSPDEAWTYRGRAVAAGSLQACPPNVLRENSRIISNQANEVFAPTARQSIGDVALFSDRVVVAINDNVRGRLSIFVNQGEWGWQVRDVSVPDNSDISLGDSSKSSGELFVSSQNFLTPTSLGQLNVNFPTTRMDASRASPNRIRPLRSAPALFDASTHVTEQFEATSTDGTKVPYFVTRPRNQTAPAAAILFGYGGFQISFPPAYKPEMGKLWLERGGVFVQANIRGGGEFGPAWHEAALKENRQRAFDDFAAVARDLIEHNITTPKQLGIYGRSNGGVLTSVSITQHPELFNAAVIESPLIDMLRYPYLPAGASWIGEYGDPRIPAEATYIARYSAYQQLRPETTYPRAYITTNTRDDRVHPGHARKFAARLGDQGHDHLYYEETAGGHSNDADPIANARRWARHYVYLAQQLMGAG